MWVTTGHCNFYWNTISLPKMSSFFIKETAVSLVSIGLITCINTRIVIDHISFFKFSLLEFYKESSDWALVTHSRYRSQATELPSGFGAIPIGLGGFPKFWRSPICLQVLSLPSFMKATFILHLERIPWTIWPRKEPDHFSKELLLAWKVNINSLSFSGGIQIPGMTLSIMTFQTNTWLLKPQLETSPIINRTDSYWIYANTHIAMKIILTH